MAVIGSRRVPLTDGILRGTLASPGGPGSTPRAGRYVSDDAETT